MEMGAPITMSPKPRLMPPSGIWTDLSLPLKSCGTADAGQWRHYDTRYRGLRPDHALELADELIFLILPALATGCCCVLKPSEHTPVSAMIYRNSA